MIIFVLSLLVLAVYKCKPRLDGGFYEDYASPEQTRSINGICIMLILLSHTFAKVAPADVFDKAYEPMRIFLGQFVVVPFLFYSGYGIMESLKKKADYIKDFPKKRFLKIVLQFTIITLLYVIMHVCIGIDYTLLHVLLSFVGIKSIGNGGWYILATFFFYTAIILWFNIFKRRKIFAAISVAASIVILIFTEIALKAPSYYYNTVIFFAVGMFYSLLKNPFDRIVMKNNCVWLVSFVVSVLGFAFLKSALNISVLFYPIWCGFGMLTILLFTMKIKISNKALIWLGTTCFYTFTLQGIPQILFTKFLTNNYLIYISVTVVSLLLTFAADRLSQRLSMLNNQKIMNSKSN